MSKLKVLVEKNKLENKNSVDNFINNKHKESYNSINAISSRMLSNVIFGKHSGLNMNNFYQTNGTISNNDIFENGINKRLNTEKLRESIKEKEIGAMSFNTLFKDLYSTEAGMLINTFHNLKKTKNENKTNSKILNNTHANNTIGNKTHKLNNHLKDDINRDISSKHILITESKQEFDNVSSLNNTIRENKVSTQNLNPSKLDNLREHIKSKIINNFNKQYSESNSISNAEQKSNSKKANHHYKPINRINMNKLHLDLENIKKDDQEIIEPFNLTKEVSLPKITKSNQSHFFSPKKRTLSEKTNMMQSNRNSLLETKSNKLNLNYTTHVHYCPFCTHCNPVDNKFSQRSPSPHHKDDYIKHNNNNKNALKNNHDENKEIHAYAKLNISTRNILNRAVDYILNKKDIFSDFNLFASNGNEDASELINSFPKPDYPNRILYSGLGIFLLAVKDNKVNLEDFLTTENKEKFTNSLFATGLAYGYTKDWTDNYATSISPNNSPIKHLRQQNNTNTTNNQLINLQVVREDNTDRENDGTKRVTKYTNKSSVTKRGSTEKDQRKNYSVDISKHKQLKSKSPNKKSKEKKVNNWLKNDDKVNENIYIQSNISTPIHGKRLTDKDDHINNKIKNKKRSKSIHNKLNSMTDSFNDSKEMSENKNEQEENFKNRRSTVVEVRENLVNQSPSPKKKFIDYKLYFDPEIEQLLDEETKKNIQIILNKSRIKQEIINEKMKGTEFKNLSNQRQKSLVYYLIFFQILVEFSKECKERAYLLYTFFKVYFAEQENKFSKVISKLYDKIKFYKDLCKLIIQQKHKHLDKIEEISDILLTQKVNSVNLSNHKKLIQDLLNVINEKRQEIYLLNSDILTLNRELKLFVCNFETLKLDEEVRQKLKSIDRNQILKNVQEELKYKKISEINQLLLANSDIYLIMSGQRNYFYDQKEFYLSEIEKLKKQYAMIYEEKRQLQQKYFEADEKLRVSSERMNKEIETLRKLIMTDFTVATTQTDVDYYEFNQMQKNHDNAMYSNKVKRYCLVRDYIDNVLYDTQKFDPISLDSLKRLIIEVYEEKIRHDTECDIKNQRRLYLDEYFEHFMKERFKIDSVIKDCCEKAIASILRNSSSDNRVELFKRFMGIGENRLRRHVLDIYLTILRSLPLSLDVCFSNEFETYSTNVEMLIDLVLIKFEHLGIIKSCQLDLIGKTLYYDIQIRNKSIELSALNKLIYFTLHRFYTRSLIFLTQLERDKQERILKRNLKKKDHIKEVIDLVKTRSDIGSIESNKNTNINNIIQGKNLTVSFNGNVNSKSINKLDEFNTISQADDFEKEYSSIEEVYNDLDQEEDLIVPLNDIIEQFNFANKGITFDTDQLMNKIALVFGKRKQGSKSDADNLLYNISSNTINSINKKEGETERQDEDHTRLYSSHRSPNSVFNVSYFIQYFKLNCTSLKIKISDFLQIIIENLIEKFNLLEKRIRMTYEVYDINRRGMIATSELENIFCNVLGGRLWRISNFFLYKDSYYEREFITEEEFINYCLDYKPLTVAFLSKEFRLKLDGN